MKRSISLSLLLGGAFALLLTINFACSKKGSSSTPGTGTNTGGGSDSILINIGNNIILPSYNHLESAVNSMDSAVSAFNSSPDASKLANLQTLFKNAYVAWEA